ncbi:MAG: folylpolyglutamate synthase/dihydrofolate synthase family protein [Eubacteriales bacterium]|nr:folylpolyglutamate synthase/dihydrofolate synthase family protein [Eubacteriales bacterium]
MVDEKYNSIVEYLDKINQYTNDTGVSRGRKLLRQLGYPQEGQKIIHVAGTNGKGSVCAYTASIFKECGYRVGLFTSPHLVDIRERIQINGQMAEKEQFIKSFILVREAEQKIRQQEPDFKAAYFDYIFAMAMIIFSQEKVDFIVLETGLGGRLDITNAVEKPVVSVITTISLEHTAILGDTVEKIAAEKAGIIKEGIPVIYCNDNPAVSGIIESTAADLRSMAVPVSAGDYEIIRNTGNHIDFSLHNEYYKCNCFSITTAALYQVMNASLALTAASVAARRTGTYLCQEGIDKGVRKMYWPGRMEEVLTDVYIDGAHNPQGIAAFVETADEICQKRGVSAVLLFSVVSDKDYGRMIKILEGCRHFKSVLVAQTGGKRQLSKEKIASGFLHNRDIEVYEFESVTDAFEYGQKNKEGLMFCAGSLYLAGEIKEYLKK